jgi:hypothetical protein
MLDGEGWHNAANGCRYALDEIKRLRAERDELLAALQELMTDLQEGNEYGRGIDFVLRRTIEQGHAAMIAPGVTAADFMPQSPNHLCHFRLSCFRALTKAESDRAPKRAYS